MISLKSVSDLPIPFDSNINYLNISFCVFVFSRLYVKTEETLVFILYVQWILKDGKVFSNLFEITATV